MWAGQQWAPRFRETRSKVPFLGYRCESRLPYVFRLPRIGGRLPQYEVSSNPP